MNKDYKREDFEYSFKNAIRETMNISSPTKICKNRHSQEILKFQWMAVPYLLSKLDDIGELLAILLLGKITKQHPFSPKDAGHVPTMVKGWKNWGNKYIPSFDKTYTYFGEPVRIIKVNPFKSDLYEWGIRWQVWVEGPFGQRTEVMFEEL